MVHRDTDLRSFLLEISYQLEQEDVRKLAFYFNFPKVYDARKLFEELENNYIISVNDISQLITGIEIAERHDLSIRLQEFQASMDKEPNSKSSAKFAGRIEEVKNILLHLTKNEISNLQFLVAFISGMPGVGKTFLVEEVVRKLTIDFNNQIQLHFIRCRGLKHTSDIADILKEELQLQASSERIYFKVLEKKLKYSTQTQLIVLDNVEDAMENDVEKFDRFLANLITAGKNAKEKHYLLVTSRKFLSRNFQEDLMPQVLAIQLDKMTMSDSRRLILRYIGRTSLEWKDLDNLATLCGQHPLAMALVASRIRRTPSINVQMMESAMRKEPLATLRHIEQLGDLGFCPCIEGTFEQIFTSLKEREQLILIAIATAPHDMKAETIMNVVGIECDEFSEISCRLVDHHLINIDDFDKMSPSSRYSMHLLTRHFIHSYCSLPECPLELKKAYQTSKKKLLDEYGREMKDLRNTEITDPTSFSSTLKHERLNYLPLMAEIFDHIFSNCTSNDHMIGPMNVLSQVMYNTQGILNVVEDCLKRVKRRSGPTDVLKFFELHYFDVLRQSGRVKEAKEGFKRIESELADLRENQRKQLQAFWQRFYGRCLANENSRLSLKESVRILLAAVEGFEDELIFKEDASRRRELALAHYDLGNTYFLLSRKSQTHQIDNIRSAKKQFNISKRHYESFSSRREKGWKPNPRLFDIYLSIGNCDIELLSLNQMKEAEINEELAPSLKLYSKAERIAETHRILIKENPTKMLKLYHHRAIFHHRLHNFVAAANDAKKALKQMKQVSRTHDKIIPCLNLLGMIYTDSIGIPHRLHEAFKCFKKALFLANRLFLRRKSIGEEDLAMIEFHLLDFCDKSGEDSERYEIIIKAIRDKDRSVVLDKENFSGASSGPTSSSSDESIKEADNSILSSDKEEDNRSSDDDRSYVCAPPRENACELARRIKQLREKCQRFLQDEEIEDIKLLENSLDLSYPMMDADKKGTTYQNGLETYDHLKKWEANPVITLNKCSIDGKDVKSNTDKKKSHVLKRTDSSPAVQLSRRQSQTSMIKTEDTSQIRGVNRPAYLPVYAKKLMGLVLAFIVPLFLCYLIARIQNAF